MPLRSPSHGRQMPAKAKGGRVSSRANQCGTFGLVSVHSQNDVAGTRQRNSGFSQLRQYELFVLRTLVTGLGPPLGGGGKPQRIMVRLRAPLSSSLIMGANV